MRIDGTMQDNSSLMQRTGEAKDQGKNTHQKKEDVKSIQAQALNLGQDSILTRKKQGRICLIFIRITNGIILI